MEHLPGGLQLRFHPMEQSFPTWYGEEENRATKTPCFVNKGEHTFSDGVRYDCIGYQFYFEENRAIGLWGIFPTCACLGYHQHDVEGIYILFDKETKEPRHVYFKAHGSGQGEWRDWDECLKTGDGALVVYFALNSHATYCYRGRIRRILGFANDLVADGGRYMRITQKDCIPAEFTDITSDVKIQSEIPRMGNTSITDMERRHLAILNRRIRARVNAQYS